MLREDQIYRYSRHVLLLDVGGTGQERFLSAAVALPRLDAAGQAAALYLAATGVGRLVVSDESVVDAPGPLFELEDVGRPRRDAALARVAAVNGDCQVVGAADGAVPVDVPATSDPLVGLEVGAAAARHVLRQLVRP